MSNAVESSPTKPRILVVEDEWIVAHHLMRKLQSLGYQAAAVSSGEQALPFIAKYRPDLVMMDINLAGLLDGIETATRLRSELSIPVIYVSSYADEATRTRANSTQPVGLLTKPYTEEQLKELLQTALVEKAH
jgi:CheY-like chemotaxis protein